MMPLHYDEMLRFALLNFGLVMWIIALPLMFLHYIVNLFTKRNSFFEIIFRWTSLFAVGFTGIYVFVMHAFFPVTAAANIGWHVSPFQFEVAVADLAFGVLGILAFKASYSFRLAFVIGLTFWLWGNAAGHVYQMITQNNLTGGNAGSWFGLDIAVPLILIMCMLRMRVE